MTVSPEKARAIFCALHFQRPDCRQSDPVDQVIAHVRARGSIQFDPLNVAGRNPDLTLQSRVESYDPAFLSEALYGRFALVDGFDKNLCIYPASDYPFFSRMRSGYYGAWSSHPLIVNALDGVLEAVAARGPLCSDDLDLTEKVRWPWGRAPVSRAALETLWMRGDLVLHHREGARRFFDLAARHLPEALLTAPDPNPDEESFAKWQVLRRIRSVGLLWNRASDAFLGLNLKSDARNAAFRALLRDGLIEPIEVTGLKGPLYMAADEAWALSAVPDSRARVIAPLDNLMWDRKLIEALFGFRYRWEVYVPAEKREYGYYVLPVLQNGRFVARFEPERGPGAAFAVKSWWDEPDAPRDSQSKSETDACMERFSAYVGRVRRGS